MFSACVALQDEPSSGWICTPTHAALRRRHNPCVQSIAGSSPRSSSSDKDAEEGGMLGRLTPAQRHQLAVLLDTAMLKARGPGTVPSDLDPAVRGSSGAKHVHHQCTWAA